MDNWLILILQTPLIFASVYAFKVYAQLDSALKKLSWYIFISLFLQIISFAMWQQKINNMPVAHLYTIVGFLLASNFYAEVLRPWISKGKFRFLALVFVLFAAINSIFFQTIFSFPSNALMAESAVVAGIALLALISNPVVTQKSNLVSLKWVHLGFLINYGGRLLLYIYGDSLNRNFERPALVSTLFSVISTCMFLFFCVALWKREPRAES